MVPTVIPPKETDLTLASDSQNESAPDLAGKSVHHSFAAESSIINSTPISVDLSPVSKDLSSLHASLIGRQSVLYLGGHRSRSSEVQLLRWPWIAGRDQLSG